MKNQKIVFGVDEVGRGSLAGPVMACAITKIISHSRSVTLSDSRPRVAKALAAAQGSHLRDSSPACWRVQNDKIRDSKKLSPRQREAVYNFLKKNPQIKWGIGKVGERVIDKINIFEATKLAMVKAVQNLEKKINKKAGQLLIDGNFAIPIQRKQKSIIKGDEKVEIIALASIVAKVERDRLMTCLHKKYPQYGFNQHKGYGTVHHFEMIRRFGICDIHRRSFNLGQRF